MPSAGTSVLQGKEEVWLHRRLYDMLCGPDRQRRFLWAVEAEPAPSSLSAPACCPPRSRPMPCRSRFPNWGTNGCSGSLPPRRGPAVAARRFGSPSATARRGCNGLTARRRAADSPVLGAPRLRWWMTRINRGGQNILSETAVYEGLLRVDEPGRLAQAMESCRFRLPAGPPTRVCRAAPRTPGRSARHSRSEAPGGHNACPAPPLRRRRGRPPGTRRASSQPKLPHAAP